MVAFATIFLGLVLGPQAVEVAVDGPVARIELRLDGEAVAARSRSPWLFVVDFGTTYVPHVLEAVAFDGDGEELSRAEQWLNVPRRDVEAEIVLSRDAGVAGADGGDDGRGVVARVLWESRLEAAPVEVVATLDGRPLAVSDPERIALPPHDPERLHLLRVELLFRDNYTAIAEATFGGTYADEVETRLTAVPISLGEGRRPPTISDLEGRFRDAAGAALPVVAVDEGPTELLVVRDGAVQALLDRMAARRGLYPRSSRSRYSGKLRKGQLTRFLYPQTVELQGRRTRQEQFPTSRAYAPSDGGLFWLMIQERRPIEPRRQRLAEAVAVAGVAAAMRNRRRAVLLVVGPEAADASRIGPRDARAFLADLRVPLVVWALGDGAATGPWGPQRPIADLTALSAATRDLARVLDRQRVVWLRGRHLPQTISLLEPAGFGLAE